MVTSELQLNISTDSLQNQRQQLFGKYKDLPDADWIIEGLAMEGGISVLAGEYGLGKTTLCLQAIDAFNRGDQLFDLETKSVKTLLVEQDESHYVMGNHIRRLLPYLPTLQDLEYPYKPIRWDEERFTFSDNTLEQLIAVYPAQLVIVDSLTSIGMKDINSPGMGVLFDEVRLIANKTKCGFIFLHHLNRRGTILGSVQIWNKPDNVIELKADGLIFPKVRGQTPHITQTKKVTISEGNQRGLPFYPLERNTKTLIFDADSRSFILGLFQQGKTKQEIISIVEQNYGLTTEAARKRVERALDLKSERR